MFMQETSVLSDGSEDQSLNNEGRVQTCAYPNNGNFHIALISASFKKFVCSWISSVHDCVILHSKSLNRRFQTFSNSYCFEAVNEVDEEEKLLHLQQTVA